MESLLLIPARSGSSRVINKNIKLMGKKPLVGYVVSSAVKSNSGRVVVSTNSKTIAEISNKFGAETPFLRPEEFCGNEASSLWVILHALSWFKKNENWIPDIVAYCPPTNPFTRPGTISSMYSLLKNESEWNSIVTITKPKTHPFRIVQRGEDGKLGIGVVSIKGKRINDIERSQDYPTVWEGSPACRMTRTCYFWDLLSLHGKITDITGKTYDINNSIGYEIGIFESYDMDDEVDWKIAESFLDCDLV